MARKLFCEISPFAYKLAYHKNCLIRSIQNMCNPHLAREKAEECLPYIVYSSNSLIRRTLGEVDPQLQDNKAINLALATPHISHLLIKPNEEFSVWYNVGNVTEKKGYKEGLFVYPDKVGQGIGGGLCQMSNLIHWMILHSPLEIIEHHHHDQIDMFPDYGRTVPFGTGTSIAYNYVDYRFKNTTQNTYQLILYTTDKYLCGELRCDQPLDVRYHIASEDEYFRQESDGIYRCGNVIRRCIDKKTGKEIKCDCIKVNHAKIMYDAKYVKDRMREYAND